MIKAIIFDLDGTLVDTITDIQDGLNGMLTEYGFSTVTTEQTLANINNGALELVRRSLPEEKRSDDSFVKKAKQVYEKYYSECYNCKTNEYDGCTYALNELVAQGISVNVLSNKQDYFVKEITKKLFNDVRFDFVIGQSELFPTKPDPSSTLHILSSLGIKPSDAVFVGDSNVDMITARNARVNAVGVAWGYRSKEILIENGAEFIVNTPREIAKIPNFLK